MTRRPEDSPDRFVFGWLPAIAWLVTFALYSMMSIRLAVSTTRRVDAPWSAWLLIGVLVGVALFSLRVTLRASRDARAMSARSGRDPAWPATMPLTAAHPIERPARQPTREAGPAPIESPAVARTMSDSARFAGSPAPRTDDIPVLPPVDSLRQPSVDPQGRPAADFAGRQSEPLRDSGRSERSEPSEPSERSGQSGQSGEPPFDSDVPHLAEPAADDLSGPAGENGEDSLLRDGVLDEVEQQRLADMLGALEAAGILEPGEVPIDVALEAAELAGDFGGFGLDELLVILDTVEAERSGGFEHLALYPTQGEVFDQQVVRVVEDAARLAGRLEGLGAVELEGIGEDEVRAVPQGAEGPTNAVIHFALDGQWHSLPFMMFPDGFPLGLIEGLAEVLAPEEEGRVFVEAWSDALVAISCIDRDRLADLDAALAWDGETFGMVAATSIDEADASLDEPEADAGPDTGRGAEPVPDGRHSVAARPG